MPRILVLDSGIGGLPYLVRCRTLLPSADFDYVADTAHFPYGDRDAADVVSIVVKMVGDAERRLRPDVVVVACNTATVVALAELRRRFAVPFVGVVPAIKPAAAHSKTRSIVVLATTRTVQGEYLDDLARRFAPDHRVTKIAVPGLVEVVESLTAVDGEGEGDSRLAAEVRRIMRPIVAAVRKVEADVVVLGCTHFVHVGDIIAGCLSPDGATAAVNVVDSTAGVANRVAEVAGHLHGPGAEVALGAGTTKQPSGARSVGACRTLWVTDAAADSLRRYRRIAARFSMDFKGTL